MKFFLKELTSRPRWLAMFAALAAVLTVAVFWPVDRSQAQNGLIEVTRSHDERFPNYDIRTDKQANEKLAVFRSMTKSSAADVAAIRDGFTRGEARLRSRIPALKVEYNNDIRTPEIIAPDIIESRQFLSRGARSGRADTLRTFLGQNSELVGVRVEQVAELVTAADYTNPDGRLSFVELDQQINGIPVFRGEVKAGFSPKGEMFRVVNNLAPGLEYSEVSQDFGDPAAAVSAAYAFVGDEKRADLPQPRYDLSTARKIAFGEGDSATTAEKMYFPTEPGVAVPAWRVLIWQPVNAFYVIVDAGTGTMLWRKNITEDQNQSATYYVYRSPDSMVDLAHNPYPFSPGPAAPTGLQAPGIKRLPVQRVGNEAPAGFNDLGWIADGGTKTDGNAIQAGLDRDGTDGVDLNSEAVSATRVFKFDFRPFDPNGGSSATPPIPTPQTYPGSAFQQGSVTQLFYTANLWHDALYLLGFTEQAKNFQNDNFNRGGLGSDRIRGEGQDSSGVNNANFSTPADGTRPRMQMYMWTAPNPDIDGNFDADVVIHENTHGLSNRLHGNSSGLSLDIARGMGEGWSDFYAHCLLSKPTDPINGIYTMGSYDTFGYTNVGVNNNYYGIRRFPKAVMSFVGPNGKPHNPLTFQDIDSTKINLSDGAYAPAFTGTADQVHNIGEVWSIALWEIRARMMQRLGNAAGNQRILQFVTDGMKLAPLNPTPLTERDAMISAALASGTAADVSDMWAGFALRGIGASASIQALGGVSTGGLGTVRVTEAFDLPNLSQSPDIMISDASGNNNAIPEPGETVQITVPLTNNTGVAATGTTLELVGSGTQSYGTVAHAATVSQNFSYVIPGATPCGGVITITLNANSSLGAKSFTRTFVLGTPTTTFSENFDSVTPPAVPAGWSVTTTNAAMAFVSTTASADTVPNSMFALDPTSGGGSTELISPTIPVTAQGAQVTFRHRYNSESGWDGGVLEISIAGGAFQDIVTAGGTFLQNGYNGFMATSTGNPIGNRPGWTGDSVNYVTTVVRMPPAAAGQNIQLRWRFGADNNTAPVGGGWNVDTIQFAGSFACTPFPVASFSAVTGRVESPDGRGLRNAVVTLTGGDGGTRSATSGEKGQFVFEKVQMGGIYILNVRSRRFFFEPVKVALTDGIGDIILRPSSNPIDSIRSRKFLFR